MKLTSTSQLAFARKSPLLLVLCLLLSCKSDPVSHLRVGRDVVLDHQQLPEINLYHEVPHRSTDSLINVLVEIPAGSFYKYEYDKDKARMDIEILQGAERQIDYLPYPAHYGMVPRTLSPRSEGGDGDPLDVILVGPSVESGEVLPGRLIGVLHLLDGGETDDKLIAISPEWAEDITTLQQLKTAYPGLTNILITWWSNYKGKGIMEYLGMDDERVALRVLQEAHAEYLAVEDADR